MGETLLGKPYGLTPDEQLKAHQILTASTAIKKTPYMLDLETMDRKPDIVPKVGDRVKIKSREWYEKWKNSEGHVRFGTTDCVFAKGMEGLCGRELTVRDIIEYKGYKDEKRWRLSKNFWDFVPEMFEEVYPVQEQLSSKFPKIDLNSPYLYQSPYDVKGSELVLSEEELERLKEQFFPPCSEREKVLLKKQPFFASRVEDVTKRLAAYFLVQGLDAKPKLKQIRTTHLIKLKKL